VVFFKRNLVYTALSHADYFKISQAFSKEGIFYKVKNKRLKNSSLPLPENDMLSSGIQVPAIYEFYVNQKDQFKAEKILSSISI